MTRETPQRTLPTMTCLTLAIVVLAGASAVRAAQAPAAVPTFSKDVSAILYKNCAGCHRPGEMGPMSLVSYADARPWAKSIRDRVAARSMPPWFADPHYGTFSNDPSLAQKDIDTIEGRTGTAGGGVKR